LTETLGKFQLALMGKKKKKKKERKKKTFGRPFEAPLNNLAVFIIAAYCVPLGTRNQSGAVEACLLSVNTLLYSTTFLA